MWEEEYQYVALVALATAGMLVGYLLLRIGDRILGRRHRSTQDRDFGGGWENAARNAVEEASSGGAMGYAAFVQDGDAIRVRPAAGGLSVTWDLNGEPRAFFEVVHEDEASAIFELLREIYWSEQKHGTAPGLTLWETGKRKRLERMDDGEGQEVQLFQLEGGLRIEENVHGSLRGAAVLGDPVRGKRLCELLVRFHVPPPVVVEKPKRRFLGKKRAKADSASSPYRRQGSGPGTQAEGEAEAVSAAGGSLDDARRTARETVPDYVPDETKTEHRDRGFDNLFR